jgi:large subunit ribosomal protein L10
MEWADKEDFNVQIKTGAALGKVVTAQELKALSKLPGKQEMFVGFLWALKSSPTKFLYALSDAPKRLGYALGALKAKKENNT